MLKIAALIIILFITTNAQDKKIIYLSLNDVVDNSLQENLAIKSRILETEVQDLEVWRSYSNFLPTLRYQGVAVNNLELPVLVFMGQQFQLGTKYTFQHSLDLTLPLFTGGSRFFNVSIQNAMKKSLSEELKGSEDEVVLEALRAYFGIILAEALRNSAQEAVDVAKANLDQVTIFHREGTATQLDLQRATAQYYSALPQLEASVSNRIISYQSLKLILNIPFADSVVVDDSLTVRNFLSQYSDMSLDEFRTLALENRNDLKSIGYQLEATEEGEKISLSQFAPSIALSAGVQHQAFKDDAKISWNDYTRAKSVTLSVSWPLFEGGRRVIDYQIAKIRTDQMSILQEQAVNQAGLEVEQNFYTLNENEKSLKSLQEAMIQSEESLRLSNLLYSEGMSTQLDVLNAQLLFNNSRAQYLQGVYNHNITQLSLLRSTGLLKTIWNR
jgi:outer membrane protein